MSQPAYLTLKQAIDQGYEYFFYEKEGYQRINLLSEIEEDDWQRGLELVAKEPTFPEPLESTEISEWVAERMQELWSEKTHDDTNSVYDLLVDLDCSSIVKQIEDKLTEMCYYKSSGITLMPNPLEHE